MHPGVFLDRDGVILVDRPQFVRSWEDVEFEPCAFAALRRLAVTPYRIVIVSNQSVVGRGLLSCETMWDIHRRIVAEIQAAGGRIDASRLCHHHPDDGCNCRKPLPGMLHDAAAELGIDLSASWLVGDSLRDVQAADAAGVRGMLVRTGHGARQWEHIAAEDRHRWPVVDDLAAAVGLILGAPSSRPRGVNG